MTPYTLYPSSDDTLVPASDGTKLFLRKWMPVKSAVPSGVALLVHGLGEHSGRYGHVAHVLNGLGIEVWAHDHRGFGRSEGARAKIPGGDALLDDTKRLFDLLSAEAGTQPILLGHSMGGAIAARAVTGGWVRPRALVLSSPGLKSYLSPPMRMIVNALSILAPNVVVPHGLPLDKISHDPQVLAQSASDPLNHGKISPRITRFIVDAGEAAIRDAANVSMPTLLQVAGDDKLVDPSGAREFAARVPADLCTLKIYDGLWHEVYNERPDDRERVLADLAEWLRARIL